MQDKNNTNEKIQKNSQNFHIKILYKILLSYIR